jgi:general secretion pathway protein F
VVGLLIFLAGVLTDGKGNGIDILGLGLAGVSGLASYLALLGAFAVVGILVQRWALASWRRHGVVRTIAARVPVLGRASAAAEAAAWCRAASLASHAGLSVGRLTTLASSAAPGVRIDAAALEDRLRAGATLAEALRETGRFDDRLLHAVAVGEATGNTAEVLDRIAGEFDDESQRGFEAAARGVGFAVWAVVAGLIALVIFRIFSFYVGAIREAVG